MVHVIDAVLLPTMVSVIDVDNSALISVFPNPTTESLKIETLNSNDLIKEVYIYNSAGGLMANYNDLNGLQKNIDVKALPKGTYNILLTVNDKNYSKTFVKK